jgi:rare lipoprotein A
MADQSYEFGGGRAGAADSTKAGRGRSERVAIVLALGMAVGSCATTPPPADTASAAQPAVEVQRGTAVFYASKFQGRRTASGVRLDNKQMVAAHPSAPFGCVVRVKNLDNGRAADVTIVDRGPSPSGQRRGIVIDVSQGAARELGFLGRGTATVEVEIPKRCRTGAAD